MLSTYDPSSPALSRSTAATSRWLLQIISLLLQASFLYNDEFGNYILGEETQSSS